MKNLNMIIVRCFFVFTVFGFSVISNAASFNFSLPEWASNVAGMAVNPDNGNVFLVSLSYGGLNNLWEFTSDGTLVNSTKAAFDVGTLGNLGSMSFGNNGHLYVEFVRVSSGVEPTRGVVELSQDGNTVFSTISTDIYPGGIAGVTYNSSADELIVVTVRNVTDRQSIIREIGLDGTQLNISEMKPAGWPWDIAYDPFTDHLFVLRNYLGFRGALDEYAKNGLDQYEFINSYALPYYGDDIDINRADGLLNIASNSTVSEINIGELVTCLPDCEIPDEPPPPPTGVPVPSAI